jgi:hypothetical protein
LVHHDGVVGLPSDYVMAALREGARCVGPEIRTHKKLQSQLMSGCLPRGEHWPLVVKDHAVPIAPLLAIPLPYTIPASRKLARKLGFDLLVKNTTLGRHRDVRVRARFDTWALRGVMEVVDDQITAPLLQQVLTLAGHGGMGCWRPRGISPGPYGMFTAEVREQGQGGAGQG